MVDDEGFMQVPEADSFHHLFDDRFEIRLHRQQRVEPLQEKNLGAGGMMESQGRPDVLNDVVALDAIDTEAVDQPGQL